MTAIDLYNTSITDKESCRGNLYKYVKSHCLYKQSVRVFDPIEGKFVLRDCPCGKCDPCKSMYRNMWYSRMYLHSLDYKYIYFVTLTYAPFDEKSVPIYYHKAAADEMAGTLPIFDNKNIYSRMCLSPCVLFKPHLQNFFKRLRFNTGAKFTYYACGEYGEHHQRPHYHCIIWSESPLTYADIKRAWCKSYCVMDDGSVRPYRGQKHGVSRRFMFLFGKVDFHDLVLNGTIGRSFGSPSLSAKNAFSYVCKYLNKKEYPDTRVKAAWHSYGKVFRGESYEHIVNSESEILNLTDYEHICKKLYGNAKIYENVDYQQFRKTFAPFSLSSRNPAIGLKYLLDNIERFKEGQQELPKDFEGKSILFPSYYQRKVCSSLFGLRHERFSRQRIPSTSTLYPQYFDALAWRSDCFKKSRSLSLGSLPALCRFWSKVSTLVDCCPDIHDNSSFVQFIAQNCRDLVPNFKSFCRNLDLYDVNLRVRLIPDFVQHGFNLERYERRERCYMSVGFLSFRDFIHKYINTDLPRYLEYYMPYKEKAQKDAVMLKDYLHRLVDVGYGDLYADVVALAESSAEYRQKLYNLTHQNDL